MMNIHLIFYYIGILLLVIVNIMIAVQMPSVRPYAIVNLVAVACIAYYFMNKEKMIKF